MEVAVEVKEITFGMLVLLLAVLIVLALQVAENSKRLIDRQAHSTGVHVETLP